MRLPKLHSTGRELKSPPIPKREWAISIQKERPGQLALDILATEEEDFIRWCMVPKNYNERWKTAFEAKIDYLIAKKKDGEKKES